ncbi:Armadillo type fold [Fasciola gigantica]|uniref:Armadillo type fold n=1 Tax=Fasciola gigantica TaxID=46835 RepID=A0A504YEI2_FASGI|nr:Armadillo type fold [Fasciola gigantica]
MASAKQDSATYNMTCLLREWDRAPKEKRRQFLQDFIDQHWNHSGPELESELAQMASLFLARICVWIKLTYMSGTCLTEQLQALYIFLSASSSHTFLLEFLEHGGVLCLQELCVSPHGKEIDKRWALQVLACVANAGTRYKETICECYGIRAVAECMAKSTAEETQEAARNLLEILAEGNPRFADQVYKGLIGVLPCHSPKAQQLALQTIRVLQATRETANRALIDRIIYLLESLHLEVQSAVIELVRDLMHFDIADDILAALVALLRPQREIQLGKLFTETVSSSDLSSDGSDSDASEGSHVHSGKTSTPRAVSDAGHPTAKESRKQKHTAPNATSKSPTPKRGKINVHGGSVTRHSLRHSIHPGLGTHSNRTGSTQPPSSSSQQPRKKHNRKKRTDSQSDVQPLPAFVQQASAAKCIRILAQDSTVLTKKLLKLGALSSLLYALGNLEFPDSQRQASLTVEYLCQTYPLIDQVVREAMGPSMHEEFTKNPESHYLQLTPLQADVLVSNKVSYLGGKWY